MVGVLRTEVTTGAGDAGWSRPSATRLGRLGPGRRRALDADDGRCRPARCGRPSHDRARAERRPGAGSRWVVGWWRRRWCWSRGARVGAVGPWPVGGRGWRAAGAGVGAGPVGGRWNAASTADPPVVGLPGGPGPVDEAGEHVAFARALVAVSARYLAHCEDQADDGTRRAGRAGDDTMTDDAMGLGWVPAPARGARPARPGPAPPAWRGGWPAGPSSPSRLAAAGRPRARARPGGRPSW